MHFVVSQSHTSLAQDTVFVSETLVLSSELTPPIAGRQFYHVISSGYLKSQAASHSL